MQPSFDVLIRLAGVMRQDALNRVANTYPDVRITGETDASDSAPDAVLDWNVSHSRLVEVINSYPSLPWLHSRWAGVPPVVVQALQGRSTILTNGSGSYGTAIAEYVLTAVLAFYKRLNELREAQQRAEWRANFRVTELRGRTVGILGLGDLGGHTARLFRAFGAQVIGLRRHAGSDRAAARDADVDQVFPTSALHSVLPRLDVLVISAPLTPETRGLIGAPEMAMMPVGSYLVNVGRGPIVQEAALVEALRSGHLAGAAVDVFDTEPLPQTSPLWGLPTLIISPHCADTTDESEQRALAIFLENLGHRLRGEPLRNVVDLSLGY